MSINPIFTKIIDKADAATTAPDDYVNPADGLKYCDKCRMLKEALYPADLQAQGFTKHSVMCKYVAERRKREKAERREYERMSYMTMLRSEAFHDMPVAGCIANTLIDRLESDLFAGMSDVVNRMQSNFGINKIDMLLKQPNCPFVLFVRTRKLVKRCEFEEYIRQELII